MAAPRVNLALLADVETWLVQVCSFREIVSFAAAKYGVTERTVSRYVARAYRRWESEEQQHRTEKRAQLRHMIHDAWRMAHEDRQGMVLAKLALVLMKLDGLEQGPHLQVEMRNADIRGMTPAERQAEIERLLALRDSAQRRACPEARSAERSEAGTLS